MLSINLILGFFSVIPIILSLLFFGFILYFLISILRHISADNHNQVLIIKKLEEISKKLDRKP
ncbi:hypothetical protein [Alkalihalobacillus pseudalcaliphilus]|uniref:hypothetical protein n=1 Tax=Alkalihalobacillus pseudalcaliphilus TaxID=79884 RepID=UPI00064D74C7|nr:hypothetical protein [Alkalihalobacillus pseudalcaliphilus]KMK75500.1 hypothetical protein AB990_09370 [Alkalihalobacillus pseudalcaliphilus]